MTAPEQIAGRTDDGELATPAEQSEDASKAEQSEDASKAGRLLSSLRRHHRGGRAKKLRNCAYCGKEMGAVELRYHGPRCLTRKRPLSRDKPWNF